MSTHQNAPTTAAPKLRLNEHEAAAYLGVMAGTLRGWRNQKRGPAFLKVCNAVRYDLRDLDGFLAAGRVETAS